MPVPNTFANATATIPLSQLDANFATTITLGNTAIQLGNTVTTLNNMTLANVTVSSGNVTITNVTVTTANVTTANIATLSVTGNANVDGDTTLGNASTDTVTVNGYMGVGGAASSARSLYVQSTALTGTTQIGVDSRPVFTSGATGAGYGIISSPATAAASFTQGSLFGIGVLDATKGAGSTITSQFGIRIFDQTQGNANYGLWMDVTAAASKWNIYASGTAFNHMAGGLGIGSGQTTNTAYGVTGGLLVAGTNFPIIGVTSASGTPTTLVALNGGNQAADRGVAIDMYSPGTGLGVSGAHATARIISASSNAGTQGGYLRFDTENTSGALAERMRIDSSGIVTVGSSVTATIPNGAGSSITPRLVANTTSGTAAISAYVNDGTDNRRLGLFVNQTDGLVGLSWTYASSAPDFVFNMANAERMRITSAGEVLVGGSTAINPSSGCLTLQLLDAAPQLSFYRNDTTIVSGNALGRVSFYGNDTTSNTPTQLAYIQAEASGTHAAGDNPTDLAFFTTPDGTATAVEAVRIKDGGGLQISRTAVTAPATGDGNVFSGTYTPTLTNTTNIAASTAFVCNYMRVGAVVTVSGLVDIDPTSTGNTVLGFSLPIASNFTGQTNCGGTFAVAVGTIVQGGSIVADATNDRATFTMSSTDTANRSYAFSFTYRII